MNESVLVGLLFADRIIEEKNGKKGVIGTFNNFFSQNFPASFPPWAIYAAVTNLVGKFPFSLNVVHTDTQQVVVALNGEFESKAVDDVIEITPQIGSSMFPREGKYTLTFNIDGKQVGSRILNVKVLGNSGPQ